MESIVDLTKLSYEKGTRKRLQAEEVLSSLTIPEKKPFIIDLTRLRFAMARSARRPRSLRSLPARFARCWLASLAGSLRSRVRFAHVFARSARFKCASIQGLLSTGSVSSKMRQTDCRFKKYENSFEQLFLSC